MTSIKNILLPFLCFGLIHLIMIMHHHQAMAVDLLKGFISLPLNASNLLVQRPYDVPVDQRYSFKDATRRLWVYSTDKPYGPSIKTKPRTEIRVYGHSYSSGVSQFQGYGFVPNGTSGVCIMQIFGAQAHATTLMLRVYKGALTYYRGPIVEPNIYDRWFKLNVIHDVEGSIIRVYINGKKKYEAEGRGGSFHYFKFGVYAQNNESYYMESRWRGIKVLRKKSTN